jgi:hypothetical protein
MAISFARAGHVAGDLSAPGRRESCERCAAAIGNQHHLMVCVEHDEVEMEIAREQAIGRQRRLKAFGSMASGW